MCSCPKDNTPGCTKQACALKAAYEEFKQEDIVVTRVSKNSGASHMKFKKKCELSFPPLSDTKLSVIQVYDVWKEKKPYGKIYMEVACSTYVINEEGVTIETSEKVSPVNSAADILQYVEDIRQTSLYTPL